MSHISVSPCSQILSNQCFPLTMYVTKMLYFYSVCTKEILLMVLVSCWKKKKILPILCTAMKSQFE